MINQHLTAQFNSAMLRDRQRVSELHSRRQNLDLRFHSLRN
jgi:hypothetical protein